MSDEVERKLLVAVSAGNGVLVKKTRVGELSENGLINVFAVSKSSFCFRGEVDDNVEAKPRFWNSPVQV